MRTSQFHLSTLREVPADAEIASHRLMLRAGMIRRLTSGIYTWTPLGLRVLRNVERIVRQEMDAAGAIEMLMPAVQPAELWRESGRWEDFGPLLLTITDHAGREYCFGPTHEEVITDFARAELRSFKQLPVTFYQIQTKFRDEIRPRFGVMRAREFLMKDAYSFHLDAESLARTYQDMHRAYSRIFTRLGLEFRPVKADSGAIGGNASHEFHVLAETGEDRIAVCPASDYAANIELAEALSPAPRPPPGAERRRVATPGAGSIDEVSALLGVGPERCVKTLVVHGANEPLVALVLRGDHELNTVKAEKHAAIKAPLTFASAAEIAAATGAPPGSLGPIEAKLPVIVDRAAAALADFVCGSNVEGFHETGVNWERDAALGEVADLRNVVAGDPSPDGAGPLTIVRGIEVGHIFQLGDKYSTAMHAVVLDSEGQARTLQMGCYGIGVSRIVAAAIEQNHDERGIIWPAAMAPWQVAILPLNGHKSPRVVAAAESLHVALENAGLSVLLDDRPLRPGVMFNDIELIGIPELVIVGERALDQGEVEYRHRRDSEARRLPLDQIVTHITSRQADPGSGAG